MFLTSKSIFYEQNRFLDKKKQKTTRGKKRKNLENQNWFDGALSLIKNHRLISLFRSLHFGSQNLTKSTQKSIPRSIQKMIDFWIDFLPKLAPFWDPSWDPRAAQDGPKTPPRRHQDRPRATRAPKIEIWTIFGPKIRWGTPPLASIFEVSSNPKRGGGFAALLRGGLIITNND